MRPRSFVTSYSGLPLALGGSYSLVFSFFDVHRGGEVTAASKNPGDVGSPIAQQLQRVDA